MEQQTPPKAPMQQAPMPPNSSLNNNNMLLVVIVILAVGIIGALVYFFSLNSSAPKVAETYKQEVALSPQEEVVPTSALQSEIEKEAAAVDLGDVAGDFVEVNSDLNQL